MALCCIVILLLIVRLLTPRFIGTQIVDTSAFADEIAQFRLSVGSSASESEQEDALLHEQSTLAFFYFDPNLASNEDWEKLGLSERQIRNIRNYQASGGSFRRREDLQRLYTISTTQYQSLEPYIRIAANVQPARQTFIREEIAETVAVAVPLNIIELNTADSSLLTQLPGIGPVLASRTVRYRGLIGGFTDIEQLSEVYGVNLDLIERLAPRLSIDSSYIRKIHVNSVTLNALMRHPYINEQQARGIVSYRQLQNRINNIEELVRNNILEANTAQKIKPYLSFE